MSSSNPSNFISGFQVSYSDDKPHGSIDEISGQSADMNKGCGGSYVWLIPQRATSARDMVSAISFNITGGSNGGDDLAKGAGGDYRYLDYQRDMQSHRFITEAALFRSGDQQDNVPSGWDGMTKDFNSGRGGDYLYLIWKTQTFTGSK